MADCKYIFTGKDGKPVLIAGKENFKAWLAENLDTAVPGWDGKANSSKPNAPLPDTITIDGVKRPTRNSKGQPIHSTEEGLRNFWRWFAGSKVVDGNGRPLVVYHGTDQTEKGGGIRAFKMAGGPEPGAFFTNDPATASEYSERFGEYAEAPNVVPAYLSMPDAKVIDGGGRSFSVVNKEAFAEGNTSGIIVRNILDGHSGAVDVFVAARPEQIKSATGNTGDFSPSNPDIRYSKGGKPQAATSRGGSPSIIHPDDFDAKMRQFKRAFPGVQIVGHDSDQAPSVPRGLRASIKRQGATGDVKGAYHDGEIHIFRNAIPDIATLEFTVLHENTHFGLSSFMGASLDEVMLDINQSNPRIAKVASRLQRQYGYSVARSTEEALADLGGDMVKVKGWQKFVAAVRDWLRKHGFVSEWSDNDIAALVMRARDYAKDKNATTVYRGSVFKAGLPQTVEVDGVERPTTNSKGQQIHPDIEGVRNFWRWFGDSRVVDSEGRPLVVYHGTVADFDEFNNSKTGANDRGMWGRGHYFAASEETANSYALRQGDGARLVPAYIAMKNPLILQTGSDLVTRMPDGTNVKALIGQNLDGAQVKAIALSRGNDGVIQFRPNGIIGDIAAYQPSQIKSATGNSGAFDPSTPDIRLSRASILTPAQRALTKTDKFAEWFGNSKMKAQDGTPLLFMHGTPSSFEAFSNDALGSSSSHASAGLGHFFTRDMQTAQKYAQGGTVLKGWLRIERPYVMKLSEAQGFEDTKASAARRVALQKQGYDGAVILDDQGKPWAMVAFEPWQYKTTDNRGTFDEFDDRFRFSRQNRGMDDENNVAGKQAPTPAGDVEAGGAKPRFTPRNWREWYELPQFQSDDQSTVLFNHGHGGYIKQVEARTSGVFDGIFALPDPGMTERGPDVTAFRIPDNKMLSQRDLDYELDSDEVSAALIDVFPRKIKAGSERFDSVWSAVVEDKSDHESLGLEDDGSIREDSFMDILGYSAEDAGEASWFAQKLRGRLAAKLGYQAVQMDDENGSSWYIVPGVKSIPLNEPSASASSDAKFSRSGQAALGTLTADQQTAVERVFGKPKTTAERVKEFTKDWKKNLIQGVFDQYAPIKELDSKGYVLARLAKGGDSTLEAMLLYGKVSVDNDGAYQVDYDGKNMNGFAKAMGKLDGEHDRFLAWVSGLRAESLAGIGLENLMSKDDIEALKSLSKDKMQNGKPRAAAYAEALRALNEFNDSVLKVAVDSGLIDEATRKMYKDTPYVPFYRLSEEDAIQGPTVSKGLVNQSAWKKLKGGTDKLNEDLMGNLLKNWSHLITASANNRAAKQILDTAAQMGVATDMTNDVVAQDINGQPIYRSNTKGLVRYRGEIKRKIPAGQPYVENGQTLISDGTAEISYVGDRYFKVDDPHLMDAIASIGFTQKVWKPLATFKRLLTFGVTVNPTFKIRNLIRDSIQAIGTADLSANPVKNILMGAKGTEMLSQTRAQMLASGGMLRFGSAEGGYSAHVRRLIEKGVDPAHILDDAGNVKAFWKHKILPAFEAYQELGDRSENVNRAALYERLKSKGMSHADASFWARDLMDFSMSGKWQAVRTLTAVVPFMNARLQGLYKLGRATKQDYKRMGATLAAVSMASIALMMHYSDDDDWKKREDWDRDNSWWFKIGDTAYRIPKPFEIGAIGTIAERSVELVISDEMTGKRFADRMRDLVMHNLSMNPTPQLVKPMIDLYANKDSFSGRDIETQGMERMRPEDRYNERTSEVGRFLGSLGLPNPAQLMMGRVESLSPVQIDHLIRGYFSWLGTSATTVLDYGLRPMMDRGETPERRLKDIFLVGNFVESLPSGSSRYVTEFYNQAKEIEQMYASYQQAMKEGDIEKAEEIKEEGADKFAKRGLFNAVKRQESEISSQMRQIERDKTLSAAEKRERLSDLEDRRDRLARRAL